MSSATIGLAGQGWLQVGELVLAFVLSSLVGLERQLRGRSAGLRTQAIVGTTAALMLLVSKYGFDDVLGEHVTLDPSRVAAQVVSGVGFLGAGLILTRRGAVRGLTTAASVWETAAIGMAAGAGLWLLALVVTALHFVVVVGYTAIIRATGRTATTSITVEVVYSSQRALLPVVLARLTAAGWAVVKLVQHDAAEGGVTAVQLDLAGPPDTTRLLSVIGDVEGVRSVNPLVSDELE